MKYDIQKELNAEKLLIISFIISMACIFISLLFSMNNYDDIKYYENERIPIIIDEDVKPVLHGFSNIIYEAKVNGQQIRFSSPYVLKEDVRVVECKRIELIKLNSNPNSEEFLKALSYEETQRVINTFFWIGYVCLAICIVFFIFLSNMYYGFEILNSEQIWFLTFLFIAIMIFSLIVF